MDKRRLCVEHPFRGQANLTRSWCNEVALCRTSSLQQALSPVADLYDGHATQQARPPQSSAGATSRCTKKRDAPEFTR